MGHTTDFIGHVDIHPTLNPTECAYLSAFVASRRYDRADGPYEIDPNPYAATCEDAPGERYNRPGPGQPQLWCQWTVCWEGCCLSWDGREKFYQPVPWLEYLIEHFLRPGAVASTTGDPLFDGFGFDHHLEGTVVGCRRDTRELFTITVADNIVEQRTLRPGDPIYYDLGPLAYEEVIDQERVDLVPRGERRRRGGLAVVQP